MEKFIAVSAASKKIIKVIQLSVSLNVNSIILGPIGVGKKLLANKVSLQAPRFDIRELEELLIVKKINLDEYSEIIVFNIHKALNPLELMNKLSAVKVIATAKYIPANLDQHFAVKIDIPPLNQREEDLQELIRIYKDEVELLLNYKQEKKNIEYDLSSNALSLKRSIFKAYLIDDIASDNIDDVVYNYVLQKLNSDSITYKELLSTLETSLLKAISYKYKSQLQMANQLKINRVTLRKKLDKYL